MRIHVLSLGCARALVDSEGMAGLLDRAGHRITDRLEEAECVVVNTCAFIREAEEESVRTVVALADLKRSGKIRRLFVTGCLPQKRRAERNDLLNLLPEVDGFLGTGDLEKLPELIQGEVLPGPKGSDPAKRFFVASPVPTLLFESTVPRVRMNLKHFTYLKVSEGCDHACTFCSIPQYRGPHRSRSMEDLVAEAETLAAQGVVELNLIGQDSSAYGLDRYGRLALPELLTRLNAVEGIRWIRILYAHPAHVTDDLIVAIRALPKVVKYIDIPFQHVNDQMLSRMRRETDGAYIRKLIERFRKEIPGVALRTTFIVGFPGETEAHVEELARFMKEARFERLGIFAYSPEPKTSSERMEGQVPDSVKQGRYHRLMGLQQGIAREINETFLGREMEVLVDEADEKDPHAFLGRTAADAPEVDGQVFLTSREPISAGQFVRARIVDTYEYDLVGQTLEPA